MRARTYGFFGGSFDPVQNAHLRLAQAALKERGLTKVFFVPAGRPPHKAGLCASSADRLSMLRLALRGRSRLAVAQWDLSPRGPSYTVNTMARLRRAYPGRRWEIVVGGDSLRDFQKWRRWREILKRHILVVGPRRGVRRPLAPKGFEDRVVHLRAGLPGVSATEARGRAAAGKSLRGLVPPAVNAYIRRRGLYRG